jgi:hypothetical protein
MHLLGFTIKIYYDARSYKRKKYMKFPCIYSTPHEDVYGSRRCKSCTLACMKNDRLPPVATFISE